MEYECMEKEMYGKMTRKPYKFMKESIKKQPPDWKKYRIADCRMAGS